MSFRDRVKAALAAASDGVPTPETRLPSGLTGYATANGIERDKPPKDAYEKYRSQYRGFPLVRAAIDLRASETVRPGYLIKSDNDDLAEEIDEWLSEAAIYAGETNQPFLPLLWQIARDHDLDGEPLIEHVYDDPKSEDKREFMGLKLVDPATVQFLPYSGTSMLVRPDDDPADNPRLEGDHPKTNRDELAAYVQFPDGYTWTDRDAVYLSQNDITRVPRNPGFDSRSPTQDGPMSDDVGNIRGVSLVEAVSEEVARLRARFQDQNAAIAGMAYPRLKVEFRDYVVGSESNPNAEIVHWDNESIRKYMEGFDRTDEEKGYSVQDEYKEPGGKFGSPPGVDTELIPGSVPDISDANTESINLILSGLNVPKYAVGYGEDLNRRVSEEQETRFEQDIKATRRKIERSLTEIVRKKAKELADENGYSESDVSSTKFRIETESTESVIRDEEFDADKFSQIVSALTEFFNSDAPNYVPPAWIEEELNVDFDEYDDVDQVLRDELGVSELPEGTGPEAPAQPATDTPQPPEDEIPEVPEIPEDVKGTPEEDLFKELANRVYLTSDAFTTQSTRPDGESALEWNPVLHPRDPRTGRFVERPFDVPDAIRNLSTDEIVSELSGSVDDFESKVEGLADGSGESYEDILARIDGRGSGETNDDNSSTGIPDEPTDMGDVADDVDSPGVDDERSDGGIVAPTLNLPDRLKPADVSKGDSVVVRDSDGTTWEGSVDGFKMYGNERLARVAKDDGTRSSLVGDQFEQSMYPPGSQVGGDVVQVGLERGDVVRVAHEDGRKKELFGTVWDDNPAELIVEMYGEENKRTISKESLSKPGTEVIQYPDADKPLDVPGTDPLTFEQGGLADVPDTDDAAVLANAIQRQTDHPSVNHDNAPIDDEKLKVFHDTISEQFKRARTPEIAREYAARTVVGNDIPRAHNGKMLSEDGRRMNFMTLDNDPLGSDVVTTRHEMGHGLVQLGGYDSGNNQFAQDMNYWAEEIDPDNTDDFQKYLLKNVDGSPSPEKTEGWNEWADEVRSEVVGEGWETDVQTAMDSVEPGDVIEFAGEDDIQPGNSARVWEVYQVDDYGRRTAVHIRDGDGHYHELDVANEDDREETGSFRYLGLSEVSRLSRGYSDPDDARRRNPTRFTEGGSADGKKTVDSIRSGLNSDADYQERIQNFVSASNRAFYKMHLNKKHRGAKYPIKSDYSSTTASEVPSEMNELFQTTAENTAKKAARVAEDYPELTAAYLELFEPSDPVKEVLDDVDGVTL